MIESLVKIDCSRIHDWPSFHEEFSRVFGFPGFYGRNMDAWIDCMSSLDAPDDGMSSIHCGAGKVLTIELNHVKEFKSRCSEQYATIVEGSAFVNWTVWVNGSWRVTFEFRDGHAYVVDYEDYH